MPDPAPPPSVVDFVLSHARVRTNVCTLQEHAHGYTLARRTVPDYNFIYITHGRVTWTIDDTDFPLSTGRLVVVPPGVVHHAGRSTRRVTLGSVHVDVTLPGGQDVFALLAPPRRQAVLPGSRLDIYLRGAMDDLRRPDTAMARLMLESWGRMIALELLRDNADRRLLTHRPVDPLVAELLAELHRRVGQPVTLSDLARWSGFSAQHLNRLFNRVLGVTPLGYLTRLRLERAAGLLADGRLTVRAVARQAGFDDPYYFSRLFKQHLGASPAHYRAAAGSDSPSPRSPRPSTPNGVGR